MKTVSTLIMTALTFGIAASAIAQDQSHTLAIKVERVFPVAFDCSREITDSDIPRLPSGRMDPSGFVDVPAREYRDAYGNVAKVDPAASGKAWVYKDGEYGNKKNEIQLALNGPAVVIPASFGTKLDIAVTAYVDLVYSRGDFSCRNTGKRYRFYRITKLVDGVVKDVDVSKSSNPLAMSAKRLSLE